MAKLGATVLAAPLTRGAQPDPPANGFPSRPVFQVDVIAPTKDKPQSKLWFAQGTWWAWLPVRGGSSIWRRTASGWQRQTALDAVLRDLPGQADVWADASTVRAVLVEPKRIAVASLRWETATSQYRPLGEPLALPPGAETETATLTRDGAGRLWIAYNANRRMWARASVSPDATAWTDPIEITMQSASADDICVVTALPGEIGVMWSDQEHDAVFFRRHANSAPPAQWKEIETVAEGGKTADDHFNIAALDNGALFAATKNSVDRIDFPQHVLRVRSADGTWSNLPYAPLTRTHAPTRPIAQLTQDGSRLYLLHTLALSGRRPAKSIIVCQSTTPAKLSVAGRATPLIDADAVVNNVTGSKARLPGKRPWIVLASDQEGRVYEGQLP